MECITKLTIKNIKGMSDWTHEFDGLVPNKINIFVGPNGYGKTSIRTAFECSSKGKMKIYNNYLYMMNEKNEPYFEITYKEGNDLFTAICDRTLVPDPITKMLQMDGNEKLLINTNWY